MGPPCDRRAHLNFAFALAEEAAAEEVGGYPDCYDADEDYDYHYYPFDVFVEPGLTLAICSYAADNFGKEDDRL